MQEIGAIQAQRLDRRAATHRGGARAAFGKRGLAEAVARLQGGENNFVSVLVGFDHARPAGDENIKSVRRFALPNEKVAELVILLLQEWAQFFEMLLRQKLKEGRAAQKILVGRFHFVR